MKKIIVLFFSFFALHAAGKYDGVYFTDSEEALSLTFVNYYPYQDIVDLRISTTDAGTIVNNRPYANLSTVANLSGIVTADMQRIREASHLVNPPEVVNALGLTLTDHQFLMSLMGALIGFLYSFGLIYTILNIARGR